MAKTQEGTLSRPVILDEVRPAVMPRGPIVENDRDFAHITEKICGIVEAKTPKWWWICFSVSLFVTSFLGARSLLSCGHRCRSVGTSRLGLLGMGHRQLRLVDRNRPCRNPNLGDSLSLEAEMAHLDQPSGRGHDHLCRHVRGNFPALSHRACLVWMVAPAAAQCQQHLAEFSQSTGVGRVCRIDLFHGLAALLVHGDDSRPGDPA